MLSRAEKVARGCSFRGKKLKRYRTELKRYRTKSRIYRTFRPFLPFSSWKSPTKSPSSGTAAAVGDVVAALKCARWFVFFFRGVWIVAADRPSAVILFGMPYAICGVMLCAEYSSSHHCLTMCGAGACRSLIVLEGSLGMSTHTPRYGLSFLSRLGWRQTCGLPIVLAVR